MEYFSDNFYNPQQERGILWKDPKINLEASLNPTTISEKDRNWALL
jgi:dTDP-4-dehydrorhamnose 3,5-epimerase-like enzyme